MSLVSAGRAEVRTGANWFRTYRNSNHSSTKLFCFPYAGSGPSIYREWGSFIPTNIELIGVNYPGREALIHEQLCIELETIVDRLIDQIVPLLDKPFAFFGHSMGAYVCYELARKLNTRFHLTPEHIFLSGAGAPHIPEPHPIHDYESRDFLKSLIQLNGFPREVLKSPDLIQFALPILRADFTACETYCFDAIEQAVSPLTVFGGESDPRVNRARIEAWRHHASVSFAMHMFPGDHFFLRPNQKEILNIINSEITTVAQFV